MIRRRRTLARDRIVQLDEEEIVRTMGFGVGEEYDGDVTMTDLRQTKRPRAAKEPESEGVHIQRPKTHAATAADLIAPAAPIEGSTNLAAPAVKTSSRKDQQTSKDKLMQKTKVAIVTANEVVQRLVNENFQGTIKVTWDDLIRLNLKLVRA